MRLHCVCHCFCLVSSPLFTDKTKTVANLRRMCEMAVDYGARVYIMTMPDTMRETTKPFLHAHEKRLWVNELIRTEQIHDAVTVINLMGV